MRTLFTIVIGIMLLVSCSLPKPVILERDSDISVEANQWNCQNYREYKKQEILYYQYVLENRGDRIKKRKEDSKKEEVFTSENINHKKELIQTLEKRGLKPCRLVEKILNRRICSDSATQVNLIEDDPIEESKPKQGLLKDRDHEWRHWFWQGVFKILSTGYFIFLALTNFQLFTMIFPTAICLLACICYPIWWKRGYLDNPYAKIATFIAAYGGLFANILWIILYI